MLSNCSTCLFFEPTKHRGQKYDKGFCKKQRAHRISDGFEMRLSIFNPEEWICDLWEENPKPVYALVDKEQYLVPPVIVKELLDKGWVLVEFTKGNLIKKHGE